MRIYFLCITSSEFTKTGDSWLSPVIDLYDNRHYTNYSVSRSPLGQNTFGTKVWTGNQILGSVGSDVITDTGIIRNNRYIDTSGSLYLDSFFVDITKQYSGIVTHNITVYSADATPSVLYFPQEWAANTGNTDGEFNFGTSTRYVRFELNFESDTDVAFDAKLWVRVSISLPVMAALNASTERILDKFPSWMALRDITTHSATPTYRYPTSIGGKVIDAIAGEWLDDIFFNSTYLEMQLYIDTVDINQPAWIYKTQLDTPTDTISYVTQLIGDGVVLAQAYDTEEFFEAAYWGDDVYYMDYPANAFYTIKSYNTITSNGVAFDDGMLFAVWNYVDEIALRVDLTRLHGESNENFRKRIKDVFINRGGVGFESFKLGLRRELDLWRAYGSTPDSEYIGATPSVLEIADLRNEPLYYNPDGMPTEKMKAFAMKLANNYPIGWGKFHWESVRWDVAGYRWQGVDTLPYRYDATPSGATPNNLSLLQSGVGDDDDLLVYRPDAVTGPYPFSLKLKARGRKRTSALVSSAVKFQAQIYGIADAYIYNNPVTTIWLSVSAYIGTDIYVHNFQISSASDIDVLNPTGTANSYTRYDIFDDTGGIVPGLTWVNKITGQSFDLDQYLYTYLHF